MTIAAPLTVRVPQKKALLIACQYPQLRDMEMELVGTHRDPITTQKLLIDIYGWKLQDINILMDDGKHQDPTRENIMRAMKELVADAQPRDQFVFLFSGHGGQVPDLDGDEELDGLDEVIWPMDIEVKQGDDQYQKNYILDDDIRRILVDSLPPDTSLVMLFDCCHSGTAADLDSCNGDDCPMTPAVENVSNGRFFGTTNALPTNYAIKSTVQKDYTEEVDTIYSPMSRMVSKSTTTTVNRAVKPFVTSWSACKDSQLTMQCEDGCFIAAFARALRMSRLESYTADRNGMAHPYFV
ncbi:hypothetical protein EUX98_g2116 [Antrodiella citrinella]|uniref:Peptidase C14 caspase domain-containing protein n=1 Tax=Antrodiella citrinella TaxID=2447956 RepID=A0A4S4N858_9APHY|nr:hypothetical protein EUX98_g2116 [Antrodiella citrinella]